MFTFIPVIFCVYFRLILYTMYSYCYNLIFFWPCIMNWLYINYQLDALVIIYSQNAILLYMFRASSAHLQEDTVIYIQHMVLSQFVVACRYTAWVRTVYRQATTKSDSTICCMYTTVSSWRWALEARNMWRRVVFYE